MNANTNTERALILPSAIDIDGQPHPFAGLTCKILERFGMTQAGFDCLIVLEATPAQLSSFGFEAIDLDWDGRLSIEANEIDQLQILPTFA